MEKELEILRTENEKLRAELAESDAQWKKIIYLQELQAKQQIQALKDGLKRSLRLEIDDYNELKKSYTKDDIDIAVTIMDNIMSTLKRYKITE